MGQFLTLVALAEQVPEHLITLSDTDYYIYIAALGAIRAIIPEWQARGATRSLDKVPNIANGLNPVTLVREALSKCPDDLPAPQSQQLAFITDAAFRAALQADVATVERALNEGEWKSATVLAGSVIEAVLLWALERKDAQNPGTALAKAKALNLTLRGLTLQEWELHPYVEVAADFKIIDKDTKTAAGLAKNYRNLIHPGRAIRLQQQCDRCTAFGAVGAMDHIIRDVEKWNAVGQP